MKEAVSNGITGHMIRKGLIGISRLFLRTCQLQPCEFILNLIQLLCSEILICVVFRTVKFHSLLHVGNQRSEIKVQIVTNEKPSTDCGEKILENRFTMKYCLNANRRVVQAVRRMNISYVFVVQYDDDEIRIEIESLHFTKFEAITINRIMTKTIDKQVLFYCNYELRMEDTSITPWVRPLGWGKPTWTAFLSQDLEKIYPRGCALITPPKPYIFLILTKN